MIEGIRRWQIRQKQINKYALKPRAHTEMLPAAISAEGLAHMTINKFPLQHLQVQQGNLPWKCDQDWTGEENKTE